MPEEQQRQEEHAHFECAILYQYLASNFTMKGRGKDVFQARREAMIAEVARDSTDSNDFVTASYGDLLKKAQAGLFQSSPEEQISALHAFTSVARSRPFLPRDLPPEVFRNLMEKVFGNHDSFRVREATLVLIAELCYESPWTVSTFMSLDLHVKAFQELQTPTSAFPHDRVSYVLNAMLLNSRENFQAVIQLGYFDFLLKTVMLPSISPADSLWMLRGIETILLSDFFDQNDTLGEVVSIAVHFLEVNDVNFACLSFYILARIIAGQTPEHPLVAFATSPKIVTLGMSLLDPKKNPDVGCVLDYFINFVCLGNEQTLYLVENEFVEHVCGIFQNLTVLQRAKVLEALGNIAVDPPEARQRVKESPIMEILPELLQTGELCVKKAAMLLLLRIIAKSDAEESVTLVENLNTISQIIDLLYSDDNELLISVIRALGLLIARGKRLGQNKVEFITSQFEDIVTEELYELTHSQSEEVAQNAQNLLNLLSLA